MVLGLINQGSEFKCPRCPRIPKNVYVKLKAVTELFHFFKLVTFSLSGDLLHRSFSSHVDHCSQKANPIQIFSFVAYLYHLPVLNTRVRI